MPISRLKPLREKMPSVTSAGYTCTLASQWWKTVAERLAQRGIVCQHIQQNIEALGAVARTALAQKSPQLFPA